MELHVAYHSNIFKVIWSNFWREEVTISWRSCWPDILSYSFHYLPHFVCLIKIWSPNLPKLRNAILGSKCIFGYDVSRLYQICATVCSLHLAILTCWMQFLNTAVERKLSWAVGSNVMIVDKGKVILALKRQCCQIETARWEVSTKRYMCSNYCGQAKKLLQYLEDSVYVA